MEEEEEWNQDEEDASPMTTTTSSKKKKVVDAKCNRLPKRLALSESEDTEVGLGDSSPKSAKVVVGGLDMGTQGNVEGLVVKLRRLSKQIANLKNKASEVPTKYPNVAGEDKDSGEKMVAVEDCPMQDLAKEDQDEEIRSLDEENAEKSKS